MSHKIKKFLSLIGPYPYNPYLIFLLFYSLQICRFAPLILDQPRGLDRYTAFFFIVLISMPPALFFAFLGYIFGKYRFWSGKSLFFYLMEVSIAQSFQFLYYPILKPFLVARFNYDFPPALTVSPAMFIGSLILGLFALFIMHKAERSINERLNDATNLVEQLKSDREELVNLDETIRNQTSRFLHDRVQSDLIVVGMTLKSISGKSSDEVNEVINQAIERLENSRSKDLRDLIQTLSPNFEVSGLQGSLISLVKQYEPNMSVSIQVDLESENSDSLHLLGTYRIVEQALLNAFVHGPAKNVLVTITTTSTGNTEVSIADDGPGVAQSEIKSGMGNAIMDSWVGILEGKKSVDSIPGHGYRVQCSFPYLSK